MNESKLDLENQTSPNRSLGVLKSYNKNNDQEYILHTSYGKARIAIFNQNIVRISLSLNEVFDDFNYAIVGRPESTAVESEETEDSIVIQTAKIYLEISKSPVRFCFKTKEGEVINEDDTFGTSWLGEQVTTYKKLQKEERFIGLGEKTGPLDRFGKGYQNWNTDFFGYGKKSDPLYVSIPFYIGIHPKGMYGIFFNNSYKSHFNFGASNNRFSSFSADSGLMDYFYIGGCDVAEIIKEYTWLTGRMPLPPKWSLGYQQCRYSYYPDKEVISIAKHFRDKDIPADAIVLDIHYMEDYKIFTWDPQRFPDPKKLISDLKKEGFNFVVMCDPGIKVEEGYEPYDEGIQEDIFISYPDNQNYQGQVWPGWCHFPDFTKPAARKWWKDHLKDYTDIGITGFWNDMNEISTWGNMLPELLELDFDGHPASMRKGRNIYGFQMARSTYEGARENMGQRPFNLTRAGFSGIQRYAAVWTGDNTATNKHMLLGVRLVNSLGISGVAFTGYDVGGFIGNADRKLFARWLSIGAFAPFFRGHSMINSRDSEPWTYGEEVEEISRNYIKLRYRLLPYLYSIFYESSQTGIPISRSLVLTDPYDPNIYKKDSENQFLFGPNILVAPVASNRDITKVYLPKGSWYDLYTDEKYDGTQHIYCDSPIEKLPVFIKGGSIVCMQEAGENTGHKADTLEIHLYEGEDPSEFILYDDDGISFKYEKGEYFIRKLNYNGKSELKLEKTQSRFMPYWKNIRIYFHGSDIGKVRINNQNMKMESETYRFLFPISEFNPKDSKADYLKIENLNYFDIPYTNEEITIKFN